MIYQGDIATQVADFLLKIKAVKLQPTDPFTWASGWRSPIYCDNRKILSYPEARNVVAEAFTSAIEDNFPETQVIAGVATGAIAHGVLVAQRMDLPFIYVRSSSKGHGLQNQIEGDFKKGQRVVVIEDLISTGGSSLDAVNALEDAGAEVLGLTSIFTYGFDLAMERLSEAGCRYFSLSDYPTLLKLALEQALISEEQHLELQQWRKDPVNWGKEEA